MSRARERSLCRRCLAFAGAAVAGIAAASAAAEPLRARIEALAVRHGFALVGAALIGEEDVRVAHNGDTARQIGRLLADYSFVLARDAEGRIAKLTIIGARTPTAGSDAPDRPKAVVTERSGAEHYVQATLTGPNGRRLKERMMLDTGASTLVLPRSLAAVLGFAEQAMEPVQVQTANGLAQGMSAMLGAVRVGEKTAERVGVTFVEDRHLGGKRLLGMSFLGRFRMTIDGATGTLRLDERPD